MKVKFLLAIIALLILPFTACSSKSSTSSDDDDICVDDPLAPECENIDEQSLE